MNHKDITPGQTKKTKTKKNNIILYEPFGRWKFETATILISKYNNWRIWDYDYGIATYRKNNKNQYIGDVVGTIGISEIMNTNNYILDNSIVIGYPRYLKRNVMYSSGNCTKGFWSPFNNATPYEMRTDCDTGLGTSGSSVMNIITTKKYPMIQSRGVQTYINENDVIDNGMNGGCGFYHGGPHVPSIIQWANLTII